MPQEITAILNALQPVWTVILNWWWLALPIVLHRPFLFLWRWWRVEVWLAEQRSVVLEIKIPKDVLKPLRAMDSVFSGLWGSIYDPPDWWETWVEGKIQLSYALEIVSMAGEPHFYIRCPQGIRKTVEANIYAQYPDVELTQVDDYTKYVPQDIPNKNWEMWGCDYELFMDDIYPIKTYSMFFEEKPEIAKEEKRLDPLSSLLEGMGKLGQGEQLWIQYLITPAINDAAGSHYFDRGKALVNKLVRRPEAPKMRPIAMDIIDIFVTGQPPSAEKKKEEVIPPEMKLTPGERTIVSAIEEKIAKRCYTVGLRFIYIAKREVYSGPAKTIPLSFFQQFSTTNLNAMKPWPRTMTKIKKHWFLPLNYLIPRRVYVRKRNLFKKYVRRFNALFPLTGGTFILNTEEIATLFHFPGQSVASAPLMERVESKKGEAPTGLPVEE